MDAWADEVRHAIACVYPFDDAGDADVYAAYLRLSVQGGVEETLSTWPRGRTGLASDVDGMLSYVLRNKAVENPADLERGLFALEVATRALAGGGSTDPHEREKTLRAWAALAFLQMALEKAPDDVSKARVQRLEHGARRPAVSPALDPARRWPDVLATLRTWIGPGPIEALSAHARSLGDARLEESAYFRVREAGEAYDPVVPFYGARASVGLWSGKGTVSERTRKDSASDAAFVLGRVAACHLATPLHDPSPIETFSGLNKASVNVRRALSCVLGGALAPPDDSWPTEVDGSSLVEAGNEGGVDLDAGFSIVVWLAASPPTSSGLAPRARELAANARAREILENARVRELLAGVRALERYAVLKLSRRPESDRRALIRAALLVADLRVARALLSHAAGLPPGVCDGLSPEMDAFADRRLSEKMGGAAPDPLVARVDGCIDRMATGDGFSPADPEENAALNRFIEIFFPSGIGP